MSVLKRDQKTHLYGKESLLWFPAFVSLSHFSNYQYQVCPVRRNRFPLGASLSCAGVASLNAWQAPHAPAIGAKYISLYVPGSPLAHCERGPPCSVALVG